MLQGPDEHVGRRNSRGLRSEMPRDPSIPGSTAGKGRGTRVLLSNFVSPGERCAGFVLARLQLGGRRPFSGRRAFAGLADLPVAERQLPSAASLCFLWVAVAFPLGRSSPCWLSFPSSQSPGLLSMFLPCLMLAFLVLIPEKEKSTSGCSTKTTEQGTCRF